MSSSAPSQDSERQTRELVERAQRGDREALGEVLRLHLPGLRAFVRLRADDVVRQREASSDLVQSVFMEVMQHLGEFEWRGEASFRNWLYTWAMNKLLNRGKYWRRDKRTPRAEVPQPSSTDAEVLGSYATFCTPSQDAAAKENLARVEKAFDALSDEYREVIVLARILGLSHQEVGARIGRTPEAVKAMLKRAMVRLTTLLDTDGDDARRVME